MWFRANRFCPKGEARLRPVSTRSSIALRGWEAPRDMESCEKTEVWALNPIFG